MAKEKQLKAIPLELVNALISHHNGEKKSINRGSPVLMQQRTKDALHYIKKVNNLCSMSDAIDMLIATVSLYQVSDDDYEGMLEIYTPDMKRDIARQGNTRAVIVNGKYFYSLEACARFYKVSRMTVMRRIENLKNTKFRKWNYADEDLDLKYRNV